MGGTGGLGGLGGLTNFQPELSIQLDAAIIWLAADRISGLSDGGAVETWANAGTLGDFTEATNPPVYKINIQNSLPIVRFDGTDVLNVADAAGFDLVDTGFSIFVCYQSNVDPVGILGHYDAGPGDGWCFAQGLGATAGNRLCLWADDKTAWVEDGAALGDANFQVGSVTNSASGAVQFYRGTTAGATNTGCTLDASSESVHLAADGVGGNKGNIDIAEILMYNTVRTAAEIALIQNYLIAKWGT